MASSTYTCGSHRIVINGGRILNHLIPLGHGRKAGDKVVSLCEIGLFGCLQSCSRRGRLLTNSIQRQTSVLSECWGVDPHSAQALCHAPEGAGTHAWCCFCGCCPGEAPWSPGSNDQQDLKSWAWDRWKDISWPAPAPRHSARGWLKHTPVFFFFFAGQMYFYCSRYYQTTFQRSPPMMNESTYFLVLSPH